jgi:hypothetical protein
VSLGLVWAAVPPPSPSPSSHVVTSSGATAVQVWTLIVAGVAVLATLVSAYLLRRTGKGTVDAAQESVRVNREIAAGAAKRAEAEALTMRYEIAAAQLWHPEVSLRVAGAYAMARLADDWGEQRPQCVDLLCHYLRTEPPTVTGANQVVGIVPDSSVRRAIVEIFNDRLSKDKSPDQSWSDLDFDLRGATLVEFELRNALIRGKMDFDRATFSGDCLFSYLEITGRLNLERFLINDRLTIEWLHIADGGRLTMSGVVPRATKFCIRHVVDKEQGNVSISEVAVDGDVDIDLDAESTAGRLNLFDWELGPEASVVVTGEPSERKRREPRILATLFGWSMHSGAWLKIERPLVADGWVNWHPTRKVSASGLELHWSSYDISDHDEK